MTTLLLQAQSTHAALRTKLDQARQGLETIDSQRRELSYEAHTAGGEAKKQLDKLNRDRVTQLASIEDLEHAHSEASRRVVEAERGVALEETSRQAEEAMEIASDLLALGQKIDDALASLAESANAYEAHIKTLNYRLNISHPSGAQLHAAMTRVLRTTIAFVPAMRDAVEFVAPGERRNATKVAEGHSEAIARIAGPRIVAKEAAE
jgi:hypothetical protein